jgi:hypothetical protein
MMTRKILKEELAKSPPILPANPKKTRREEKPGSIPVKTR